MILASFLLGRLLGSSHLSFSFSCKVSFGLQDNNVWRHIKGFWFERDWLSLIHI